MKMKSELYNYDIFPKVFLTGTEKTITIKPLGIHAQFDPETTYDVYVKESRVSDEQKYAGSNGFKRYPTMPDADGCLRVTTSCASEGMYHVQVYGPDEKRVVELRVYALDHDMAGRYPFRGDLHLHTRRSDGKEDPRAVVANYRGHGYDFTVISDHHRYYPSLEARSALRINDEDESDLTDLLVVRGEEIHLPLNPMHYVNFGGRFSVNALVTPSKNEEMGGSAPAWRSADGKCPATMTTEEYEAMIRKNAEKVPLAVESERLSFAAAEWIYEKVKEAEGLGIFPHPYWLCPTMQLSEDFTKYVYEKRPFDAFEVLGGENYYAHNGFQTSFYYEMKAKGYDYPVVGSTDSHGSTEHNRNALICSTIVFSPANKTKELISSIKEKYSVAVDTISPEYRLVGDFRFVKYGSFLMENWYPLHDFACAGEGFYLRQYLLCGDENAEKVLFTLKGQISRMMKKYFDIE